MYKLLHAGFSLTLCSDTLLNVFLAIAVDNLANAQELTKVHNSPILLQISVPFLFSMLKISKVMVLHSAHLHFALFPPYSSLAFDVPPNLSLCRMNRRKRRLPVRRSPCRKPRRWLKSAHCLQPTSPLQREFLSLLLLLSRFCIHFKTFSHQAGIFGRNICTYL